MPHNEDYEVPWALAWGRSEWEAILCSDEPTEVKVTFCDARTEVGK